MRVSLERVRDDVDAAVPVLVFMMSCFARGLSERGWIAEWVYFKAREQ
jgi:hypothetical protein